MSYVPHAQFRHPLRDGARRVRLLYLLPKRTDRPIPDMPSRHRVQRLCHEIVIGFFFG